MAVVIETTLGDLTVDLFVDQRPLTCMNFLKLCKMKYYNLNLFHSVNSNFCAQTGDPTGKGDGGDSIHGLLKGPSFRFYQGEAQPKIKHDRTGLVSMVSHGQGMFGSQFVITLSPDLDSLDGEHCVFGEIVEGNDVLLKLNETITDEHHRPYQDIRITHMVILEDPFPDPEGLGDPPQSPKAPSTKDVAYSRIPADEPLKDTATQEELDELVQAREAAARATILEMVGDLPDADIAPPENVLFVCKLNPVTSDHDLSIIFSRFGKVKSCEVIRDSVTGDSLQYAFVEFENQKACEEAYFKMDNVLIDDRRIHVDFSQSVAKWHGKGRGVEMFGPPPLGGWGNKSRRNDQNRVRERSPRRPRQRENNYHNRRVAPRSAKTDNDYREKNGSRKQASKNNYGRRDIGRKKRRRTPSSSSSSSSESSSSSDSSDSEPVRKRIRQKAEKVLVVVKAPSNTLKHKKRKRTKRRYESDSDDQKKRKRVRNKSVSDDSSSSEDPHRTKKRKRRAPSSEPEIKAKKSKRKVSETSDESSDQVRKKSIKKKGKRRKRDVSSDARHYKRKRSKNGGSKKKRHSSSESETTSSSD